MENHKLMKIKMYLKKILISCTITGFIPVVLSGCGGSSAIEPANAVTETTASTETETITETTTAAETETITETTTAAEAETITETTDINDPGVSYTLLRMINQRETVFGDYGCGGAAGLMAMQAAGYLTDYDTEEEYSLFWSSIPKAADATAGHNGKGIWNPAYARWIGTFAEADRIQEFNAEDIKQYLTDGNVVIVLVSLGETGNTTHWIAVTGWRMDNGLLLYSVADPWTGMVHEFTASRLQKRIEEAANRKGDFGAGYETEGVKISVK